MDRAKQEELELSWEVQQCLNELVRSQGWNKLPNDMAMWVEEISDEVANKLYKLGYRKKDLVEGLK